MHKNTQKLRVVLSQQEFSFCVLFSSGVQTDTHTPHSFSLWNQWDQRQQNTKIHFHSHLRPFMQLVKSIRIHIF
jgi:hypothetical protein